MRIEAQLNCYGYFGFGGGWDMVTNTPPRDGALYCNRCPLKEGCWDMHRERARQLFPDASAAFDAILAESDGDGQGAVRRYSETYESVPPDLVVNGGNIQDGSLVASGLPPKDRGPYSLTFPFPKAAEA